MLDAPAEIGNFCKYFIAISIFCQYRPAQEWYVEKIIWNQELLQSKPFRPRFYRLKFTNCCKYFSWQEIASTIFDFCWSKLHEITNASNQPLKTALFYLKILCMLKQIWGKCYCFNMPYALCPVSHFHCTAPQITDSTGTEKLRYWLDKGAEGRHGLKNWGSGWTKELRAGVAKHRPSAPY